MLKGMQVSTPIEQQAATAEMEHSSTANSPAAGAAAMDYNVTGGAVAQPMLQQPSQQQQQQQEMEKPVEMEEFKLFRDYLGLINLVKSFANVPDDLASPTPPEYSFEQEIRERRDSLGSAGSEFSSTNSAESVEVADSYYATYGHDIVGMKQAFMETEDSLKTSVTASGTVSGLPTSLLLEHKIMTAAVAKKPQVSIYA